MITKHEIQHIHSLASKKHRMASRQFVAEGMKVVGDLLPLLSACRIFLTDEGLGEFRAKGLQRFVGSELLQRVTEREMERISFLKAPRNILALFAMPECGATAGALALIPQRELCLALDGVQDPGNVGTILRIADWFGIEHVFASPDTADIFSPKVVQATMGAIGRVSVHPVSLPAWIDSLDGGVPVFGTFLDGDNIHGEQLAPAGVVVMGNEGGGISPEVACRINRRLLIPNYPAGRATSESLNVAVATAIVCAEFRRVAEEKL